MEIIWGTLRNKLGRGGQKQWGVDLRELKQRNALADGGKVRTLTLLEAKDGVHNHLLRTLVVGGHFRAFSWCSGEKHPKGEL